MILDPSERRYFRLRAEIPMIVDDRCSDRAWLKKRTLEGESVSLAALFVRQWTSGIMEHTRHGERALQAGLTRAANAVVWGERWLERRPRARIARVAARACETYYLHESMRAAVERAVTRGQRRRAVRGAGWSIPETVRGVQVDRTISDAAQIRYAAILAVVYDECVASMPLATQDETHAAAERKTEHILDVLARWWPTTETLLGV